MQKTVAIVGAGIAGASCAASLAASGISAFVVDKGRGPGGRMSTRRTDSGYRFDHGAPHFESYTAAFRAVIEHASQAGAVRPVDAGFVGVNGMNALCKHLLAGIDSTYFKRITTIRHDSRWQLADETGAIHGPFDAVVIAIPPTQAADMVEAVASSVARRLRDVRMTPCWVALLGFARRLTASSSAIESADAKVYRSSSNETGDAWVVQASARWSIDHLERPADAVLIDLTAMARDALGSIWQEPDFSAAHRWRYAFVEEPLGEAFVEASDKGLFLCGDWCLGRTVEHAWQSGQAVADRVKAMIG